MKAQNHVDPRRCAQLVKQANQVLVPTIANLHERDRAAIPRIYQQSYRLVFFLAVPSFALLAVASPLISMMWIGAYEPIFVRFVALLAIGWLVNALCNPAYVVDLGTGELHWISVGVTVTAAMNIIAGYFVGKFMGGTAIVAASVLSLIVGYGIILGAYHRAAHQKLSCLLPRESRSILALSSAGAVILLPLLYSFEARFAVSFGVMASAAASLAVLIAFPMWTHPIRRRLFQWIMTGIPT